ncbi:MAG: hypothetical protein IPP99_16350 [Chitinophagaceae bacterium]|nr:hypothetical protein [Chitinophagaceae bacterium]
MAFFVLGGRTTDRPQFRFAYTKGSMPSMFVDGKVSLLGMSSETTLNLDDKGFEFTTSGKIADMFEATLEAKGQSLGSSGGGIAVRAVLRNDIISRLNQLVTSAIDEQISSVKNSIKANQDKLKTATDNLAAVDKEIFDARRLVASDREAFNMQMLEEKQTALKTQQDLVNMDNVLGGLFDIKSAEFAGVFGLNSEYKANVAFNFTLAKKPYHFTVGIDFKNLGESAKTIAKDMITGNILKSGYSKSFADELKKPVTAYRFASETKSLATATKPPAVLYSYLINLEPTMDADAATTERLGVVLTGNMGSTELLPLTQFGVLQPGKRTTFSVQTEKDLGTLNQIRIQALNAGMTDNLKLNTVAVQPLQAMVHFPVVRIVKSGADKQR